MKMKFMVTTLRAGLIILLCCLFQGCVAHPVSPAAPAAPALKEVAVGKINQEQAIAIANKAMLNEGYKEKECELARAIFYKDRFLVLFWTSLDHPHPGGSV